MLTRRWQQGSAHLSEFGAALFLLISCIIIPLIDLAIIPVRWSLGKSMVSSRVHQLAQSETISEAFKAFQQDVSFPNKLQRIGGITVKSSHLSLTAASVRHAGEIKTINRAGALPRDWLPDGSRSPCIYQLDLTVSADVDPLITAPLPHLPIPGLTRPMSMQFHDVSAWENLGRDPSSGEFFMNE